jgi:parallel beta-helix repeat protein
VATGGRGIYLDDDLSNTTVRNNIVYGTGQWAFQFHGGDHNVLTNNIFDISGATKLGLYQDTGAPTYGMAANSFSCNIVYSSAPPPAQLWDKYGLEPVALPTVFDNLYWGASGALPNTGSIIDTSPTVSNPMFVAPASADYSFASGNPAAFCGFQPIDVSQVGPRPNE